ncbi:protein of unknown function [Taphrina deformans PYCC 5710]|uniref:Uncharacterized protein n=1 Tax=Taphrina deformans (strain PYCC 5710 / ATCC 11124 / CBS 356.35 / IMI 108563 / JCM 9778 / NBRC 8474) TaxID=1097556 RepID=R4XKP8_TAPDE|nr:protein of unknown function [Taphrina deformans PYCC 5710]|eukprot:CCG85009.2 protein of unknown function [Taphrina deformans PYCC 5710]
MAMKIWRRRRTKRKKKRKRGRKRRSWALALKMTTMAKVMATMKTTSLRMKKRWKASRSTGRLLDHQRRHLSSTQNLEPVHPVRTVLSQGEPRVHPVSDAQLASLHETSDGFQPDFDLDPPELCIHRPRPSGLRHQ